MLGLMQERPLLVSEILTHAERVHGNGEIISRTLEGPIHRCTYADLGQRARRVANALGALGAKPGERIGTLAWNGYRHLELYFGVSGMGAVLHTVNPRLFPEQITYIVNHAEDAFLCFDACFAPLVEKLAPTMKGVRGFIAMTDRAHMPAIDVPNLLCYEELLAAAGEDFEWPQFDERTACSLCYTSGTTGNPKGVLFSHRSTVLHSYATLAGDGLGIRGSDSVLMIVPMFHANAWGLAYSVAMCGAKLVMPGPWLDGKSVYALMREEGVTLALGVPTVWLMLFQHVDATKSEPRAELKLRNVVIGGSAAPRAMIERFATGFGANVIHGWGMTEMSPVGSLCMLLPKHEAGSLEERLDVLVKQGRPPFGVEMKITDDAGGELPRDGKAFGNLKVRGPWVASGYFKGDGGEVLDADGFFDTGDVATIDADGFMQITDRSKDVIKSGGEWISSIELENAALGHPAVAEAAVIALPHPKWQERPLLVVVLKSGARATREELLGFLASKVAKWWVPDDVAFMPELPHTATGKILKSKLREMFRDVPAARDTARSEVG